MMQEANAAEKMPRLIEGGDAAARVAGTFIEAFGKGDAEKVFEHFAEAYRASRPLEGTRRELENTRAAMNLDGLHSVAVMVQPPLAGGGERQAVAVSQVAEPKEAGQARGPAGIGITMVWEKGAWRVRDIDVLPTGERYEGFCERFRSAHAEAAYVDPISTTPEMVARRLVAALSAGQAVHALALLMTPEEFAAAFKGAEEQYKGGYPRVKGILENLGQLNGAQFVRTETPGGAPARPPAAIPAGKAMGGVTPLVDLKVQDGVHARVRLPDGKEELVRIDEVMEVKGSWRMMVPPRMVVGQ
jgi:hypothetical protein